MDSTIDQDEFICCPKCYSVLLIGTKVREEKEKGKGFIICPDCKFEYSIPLKKEKENKNVSSW